MKRIVLNYLKEKGYDLKSMESDGLILKSKNEEITITGSKRDLIELADYIVNIAISDNKKDHLHLDELTLINNKSIIKSMIIEKE